MRYTCYISSRRDSSRRHVRNCDILDLWSLTDNDKQMSYLTSVTVHFNKNSNFNMAGSREIARIDFIREILTTVYGKPEI